MGCEIDAQFSFSKAIWLNALSLTLLNGQALEYRVNKKTFKTAHFTVKFIRTRQPRLAQNGSSSVFISTWLLHVASRLSKIGKNRGRAQHYWMSVCRLAYPLVQATECIQHQKRRSWSMNQHHHHRHRNRRNQNRWSCFPHIHYIVSFALSVQDGILLHLAKSIARCGCNSSNCTHRCCYCHSNLCGPSRFFRYGSRRWR